MYSIKKDLIKQIKNIEHSGSYKHETIITGPQGSKIDIGNGSGAINMCSNNYLGLSNHPQILDAVKNSIDKYGYGLSSVRFICGTQDLHKELEYKVSSFLEMEDTILYSSCFDANGGIFECLLSDGDAVISDELNHASIIDGIRLCKAKRYRYKHDDLDDLEKCLIDAKDLRRRLIVTDGVFSMDGDIARLDKICDLADAYDALVMHDDSHATGFIGRSGKGVHELKNCTDRVDIITSTFGKALGGASGGFVSGKKEIISVLRQTSRPYLFSNSLAPIICQATITAIDIVSSSNSLKLKLDDNTKYYRAKMQEGGFDIGSGTTPIVPVMLYDEKVVLEFSNKLVENSVYAVGFSYPVVPKGKARIRTQISSSHSIEELDFVVDTFCKVKDEMKL